MALGLAFAVLVGLSLALFGGGGSMLSVPLLTYAFGLPAKAAIAASLWIIGVTSLVALIPHGRAKRVDTRTGLLFGSAGMLGAYAGGRLAAFVPDAWLLAGFGTMMLATALGMLRDRRQKKPAAPGRGAPSVVLLLGLVVGTVSGLVGAGGGFLIVPALVLLGGLDMKRAVATSLMVIVMNSFAGFSGHLGHVAIPWSIVLPVTLMACLGSVAGSLIVRNLAADTQRRGFAWLVLAVAVFVVARELPAVAML